MTVPARLYALAALVLQAAGQTFNQADAAAMAWRAYGDFITSFLARDGLASSSRVYILPVTQQGIAAGDPVPAANTNWEIYQFADVMLNASEPFQRTGPRYINTLQDYLLNVNITTEANTPEEEAQLASLRAARDAADEAWFLVQFTAIDRYQLLLDRGLVTVPFNQWVVTGYPTYTSTLQEFQSATARFDNYRRSLGGIDYEILDAQIDRINVARTPSLGYFPGTNMRCDPTDFSIPESNAVTPEPADANTVLYPYYSMPGLESQVNAWMRDTSGAQFRWTFRMSASTFNDYTSMGFSRETRSRGGSLFGLLGTKRTSTSESQEFNQWNSTFSQVVELSLTLQGAPAVFDITPGDWEDGDPRARYPNVEAGFRDGLAGNVRLTRVLMGYRPGFRMIIRDRETFTRVRNFIRTTTSGGGTGLNVGFRLFGFSFGVNFGSNSQTVDIRQGSELQITDNGNDGGSIEIPPSNSRRPFLLGALGRVY